MLIGSFHGLVKICETSEPKWGSIVACYLAVFMKLAKFPSEVCRQIFFSENARVCTNPDFVGIFWNFAEFCNMTLWNFLNNRGWTYWEIFWNKMNWMSSTGQGWQKYNSIITIFKENEAIIPRKSHVRYLQPDRICKQVKLVFTTLNCKYTNIRYKLWCLWRQT